MKIRILTIDGGGAKGIVPAIILQYIENKIIEITGNPRVYLSDFLDFIAGTASGSLTSTMLITPDTNGKPAYKTGEIIDNLFEFASVYYQKKEWKTLWGLLGAAYPQEQVNNKHIEIFDHWKMNDLLLPTAIPGYDILNRQPVIFTNKDRLDRYGNLFANDVVRGSCASPGWINPVEFRDGIYKNVIINGNVIANNPSMIAYIEAGKTPSLIEKFKQITPNNTLLISLGAGQTKFTGFSVDKVKRWNKGKWFELFTSINIQSTTVIPEYQTRSLFKSYDAEENYIRIDPFIQIGSSQIMNTSNHNMKNLLQDAYNYIERNTTILDNIAEQLIKESIIYKSLI